MIVRVVISLEGGVLNSLAIRSAKINAEALALAWAGDMPKDSMGQKWVDGDNEVFVIEEVEVDGRSN